MNYINKILITLTAIVSLAGCKKYLDRPPEGKVPEEDALVDEASVTAFLNGSYTVFAGTTFNGGRTVVLSELLGDHIDGQLLTGDFGEIYGRKSSIFGTYKKDFYVQGYNVVYRANKVLQHLDKTGASRNNIEGQAKFLRGVALFELVRMFAQPYGFSSSNDHPGIPLRLQPDIAINERATVKEVYDQIIADLTAAAGLLPATNGEYPTKYAVHAFLSKVYFQMNDFANAYEHANEVIAPGIFRLDTDLQDRFAINKSKEAIFKIVNRNGNYEPGKELRDNFRSEVQLPTLRITSQTLSQFNRPGDKRKAAWLNDTKYAPNIVLTKYNENLFDLPIVHLTEIKLIRAESAAELNQHKDSALLDLNGILNRALGRTMDPSVSNSLIIATARQERELEMIGEGNRLQEIKRIGVRSSANIDRRNSPWNCNGFILQFPQEEKAGNANFKMNPEGGCL